MKKKLKSKTAQCNFCGKTYKKSSGHHCSGQVAYNKGTKDVILNLDKLMVYDPQEDDMVIELPIWAEFKKEYNPK